MNEVSSGSIFPIKLLMGYVVSFGLIPTVSFFTEFGNMEAEIEGWNADLEFCLILCIPFLWVMYAALRYSRRMPIFAAVAALISAWHVIITLIDFEQEGFDSRFDLDFYPVGALMLALIWAIPFILIYLGWRFVGRNSRTATALLAA